MSTDRWQLLSEWHNAWLAAGAVAVGMGGGLRSGGGAAELRQAILSLARPQ